MDWTIIAYVILGLIVIYGMLRILGSLAQEQLTLLQLERVLNSDENKVKGRYD